MPPAAAAERVRAAWVHECLGRSHAQPRRPCARGRCGALRCLLLPVPVASASRSHVAGGVRMQYENSPNPHVLEWPTPDDEPFAALRAHPALVAAITELCGEEEEGRQHPPLRYKLDQAPTLVVPSDCSWRDDESGHRADYGPMERDAEAAAEEEPAPASFEDDNLVVRPSSIEGLGVFAKRAFKKGETVLRWRPKRLSEAEFHSAAPSERRYLGTLDDGTRVLMQAPERFVNSDSSAPNTQTVGESDVAVRDISPGEEITSDYPLKYDPAGEPIPIPPAPGSCYSCTTSSAAAASVAPLPAGAGGGSGRRTVQTQRGLRVLWVLDDCSDLLIAQGSQRLSSASAASAAALPDTPAAALELLASSGEEPEPEVAAAAVTKSGLDVALERPSLSAGDAVLLSGSALVALLPPSTATPRPQKKTTTTTVARLVEFVYSLDGSPAALAVDLGRSMDLDRAEGPIWGKI